MSRDGVDDIVRAAEDLAQRLPQPLSPLATLAFNYAWTWSPGGSDLFRSIDPARFGRTRQNPVRLLQEVPAATLARLAQDREFVERAETLAAGLRTELDRPADLERSSGDGPVAFFCAEFGVHSSLPIYAGGLGVLAGDLLKEASDRALPMVGVGLMYTQGYFHQRLDRHGWQHEYWVETDAERLPAALVTREDGTPLTITVPIRGRDVLVQVWRVDVGRVPLFLLDTELPGNGIIERWITARLYIGDRSTRLSQYALLGVGGVRALRAMGIEPSVIHLNEGHAAFAPLALAGDEVAAGHDPQEALAAARERTVFTTHTPVPAGNETFEAKEVLETLGDLARSLDPDTIVGLGRSGPDDLNGIGMTTLGLRLSRSANGVSRRHGEVARRMWRPLFGGAAEEEVPIEHITNGVHLPSWMAPPMRELLDRHLGNGWERRAPDAAVWEAAERIPDEEVWAVRNEMRSDLVDYLRRKTALDLLGRGAAEDDVREAFEEFDPHALTVGFARRVATYKRLYLLTYDSDRALRILMGPPPVQLFLAGKAHPRDEEAKGVLQNLFGLGRTARVASRVAYLEDYDIAMAARLVGGCDVWVNLPRRPLEASGTSGMKAALNGGLNLSVLDGWWAEAYDGVNGWAVDGSESQDPSEQDGADSTAFYDLLEREVLPLFYDRDETGIPRGWVRRVKTSLRTAGSTFTTARTLGEYVERVYRPPTVVSAP